MPDRAFLGVDIGTSSSKGVLVGADGTVLATEQRPHRVSRPQTGWAEQDAERIWWAEFVEITRALLARKPVELAAVGVSGLGPCLLPADATGRPLRPAMLYAIDTRATAQIQRLNDELSPESIAQRCGLPLTSQSVGPKLLWLREREPEVFGRTERVFTSSNFVVHRLTGAYTLDHLTASCFDPFYDMAAGRWADDWIDRYVRGPLFPELVWPGEIVGAVHPEGAAATGIAEGTPVICGTMDFWADNISVGADQVGDCMVSYGTTISVSAVAAGPPGNGLIALPGHLPGIYHVGGATGAAGALTEWVRTMTGTSSYEQLCRSAASVPAGADGLLMLPYFAGRRSPSDDPAARGVLCGLTLGHGPGHLYRAALEATAFEVRHVLDNLVAHGVDPAHLVVAGGGTRQRLWLQILSDVTGRSQHVPANLLGACYGVALLAARATGDAGNHTRWSTISDTIEPEPSRHEHYQRLYSLYQRLDMGTRQISHALDRWSRLSPPS